MVTAVDAQPMFDGGVLINVLGRLKVSDLVESECKNHKYLLKIHFLIVYLVPDR